MKNIVLKNIARLFAIAAFALFLTACNNDDDLQEIFVGHNWKLAFVQNGSTREVPEKGDYTFTFYDTNFRLVTPGGVIIGGNWQASANSREFHCSDVQASGNISTDGIASIIVDILKNAKSYEGDSHYLKINKLRDKEYIQLYNR